MKRTTRIVAILSTLGAFALTAAHADDWPKWRGPDGTGISSETGWKTQWPAEGPKVLWRKNIGISCSSVSVSDGLAYVMGNVNESAEGARKKNAPGDKDVVWCLNPLTGDVVWKHEYDTPLEPKYYEGGPGASPTVNGGLVYTVSKDGKILALNAKTGEKAWQRDAKAEWGAKQPDWGFNGSVLIEGGKALVNAGPLVALDPKTGADIWKTEDLGGAYSSPYAFDLEGVGRCIAVMNAYGLLVAKAEDGKEVLRHEWKTNYDVNATTPIIDGTLVFISSGYNHGGATLDIAGGTPKVLWENRNMRNQMNSCVLKDGRLYGFDEKELKCIDMKTGEQLWAEGSLGKGSLILVDGKLVIQGEGGDAAIAEVDPTGYKEVARTKVLDSRSWVSPTLSNGLLYCRNNAGDLACLDLRGGAQ